MPVRAAGRGNFSFAVNTNFASEAQKQFTVVHTVIYNV
jgi:hypothetical protein